MPSPWKLGDEGIPGPSTPASGAHDGAHSPSNPHGSVAEPVATETWLDRYQRLLRAKDYAAALAMLRADASGSPGMNQAKPEGQS